MTSPYFRPGAGSVIYNQAGEIAVFARTDLPNVWQLQQGGMDADENPEETLWRELEEETGLTTDNFLSSLPYPHWTIYAYPPTVSRRFATNCLGQVHRWFFLELKPDCEIDLSLATDQEFNAWRFMSFPELLSLTSEMKLGVYTELANYFTKNILPTPTDPNIKLTLPKQATSRDNPSSDSIHLS